MDLFAIQAALPPTLTASLQNLNAGLTLRSLFLKLRRELPEGRVWVSCLLPQPGLELGPEGLGTRR